MASQNGIGFLDAASLADEGEAIVDTGLPASAPLPMSARHRGNGPKVVVAVEVGTLAESLGAGGPGQVTRAWHESEREKDIAAFIEEEGLEY